MLTCKVGEKTIDTFSFKSEKLREWSNKSILKCPVCNEQMLYCHGDYKIPYFRHKQSSDCPDIYSELVTEEHLTGIKILYNWLLSQPDILNLELEKWIHETKQRPDIYFEKELNGKIVKYAIEFQCSPISTKFNERKDLYRLNNINDIWVLGINNYDFINKSIDKAAYNESNIEYKTKTIEREICNHSKTINYLNVNNKQIYQIKDFYNAERTRYSRSGYPYSVFLETVFDIKIYTDYIIKYTLADLLINNNIANNINCCQDIFTKTQEYIVKFFKKDKMIKLLDKNSNDQYLINFMYANTIYHVYYVCQNNTNIDSLIKQCINHCITPIIFIDSLIDYKSKNIDNIYIIDINKKLIRIKDQYEKFNNIVFDGNILISKDKINKIWEELVCKYKHEINVKHNQLICNQENILNNAKEIKKIDDFKERYKAILNSNILIVDGYYTVDKNMKFKYVKNYCDGEDFFINEIVNIIDNFVKRSILDINIMIQKKFLGNKIIKRDLDFLLLLFKKYGFTNVSLYNGGSNA